MAKKYLTEGRTLYNYRGRAGRLTIVPTQKARDGLAICDTYGNACRVLEGVFRDSVVEIGTEPAVHHSGLPAGRLHLDVRERHRSGQDEFTEVRDAPFVTAESIRRLQLAAAELAKQGSTLSFELREDVVDRVEAKGLKFLLRFRTAPTPSAETLERIQQICACSDVLPLSKWLARFAKSGLLPRHCYWALAWGHLKVADGARLFPDGDIKGTGINQPAAAGATA